MDIYVKSRKSLIAATIVESNLKTGLGVVIIAGGGFRPKEVNLSWQQHLADAGLSSVSFDFPGVGQTAGRLSDSSLLTRLGDVTSVIDEFQTRVKPDGLVIIGRSMGAHLAIHITKKIRIAGLALVAPAAYGAHLRSLHFGSDLQEGLRQKDSWYDTDDFDVLETYSGDVAVIYGEHDQVIPHQIQARYFKIAEEKNGLSCVISDMGHLPYNDDVPGDMDAQKKVWDAVDTFLAQLK